MAYKYDTRTITHGVSFGGYAEIKKGSDGSLDKTVPVKSFTGLISSSFEPSSENTSFYADNVAHITIGGATSTEGTITCYQFAKDFVINHLGKKEMANGGLTDTGSKKSFIFQFIETVTDEFGNDVEKLNIYYNCKATFPTESAQTDSENVDAKEFEIPVTANPNSMVLDADGIPVTHFSIEKTEDTAAIFEYAKEHILLPTDTKTSLSLS